MFWGASFAHKYFLPLSQFRFRCRYLQAWYVNGAIHTAVCVWCFFRPALADHVTVLVNINQFISDLHIVFAVNYHYTSPSN